MAIGAQKSIWHGPTPYYDRNTVQMRIGETLLKLKKGDPTANFILTGEWLKAFPLRSRTIYTQKPVFLVNIQSDSVVAHP